MPRIRAMVVLVAALSAVGCATAMPIPRPSITTITPAAAEASSQDVDEGMITSANRLGDLPTLDPCSLVDRAALPASLKAKQTPRDSLESCRFIIDAGGATATLDVGELAVNSQVDASNSQSLARGLDLYEGSLGDGSCESDLELGDSVYVVSTASVASGAGSDALCDAVKAAGTDVANVLLGNAPLTHFSVPGNSLVKVNACDLLDGQSVQGFTLPQPMLGDPPSGHSCDWSPQDVDPNGAELPGYVLEFLVGAPTPGNLAGTVTTIAGRQTIQLAEQNFSGRSLCQLSLFGRPFDRVHQLLEMVRISVVEPSGQAATACSLATTMAQLAWPKLPPVT